MLSWVKNSAQGAMSSIAGTAEPIYGPTAIRTVSQRSDASHPYTELTSNDLTWLAAKGTSVETQQFYLNSDSGYYGMAQVIYSSVASVHTTCQFNVKLYHPTDKKHNHWSSTTLKNHSFDAEKKSFYADQVAVVLAEDGGSYKVKSMADDKAMVNIVVTRLSPGFMAGKDGRSTYGTDQEHPWGEIRHLFWPRCKVEGTFVINGESIDVSGSALFSHNLQNMKPHHAAARWNFANFQGPTTSAVMMEFETPPSYGTTKVAVGGIAKDGLIVAGTLDNTVEHVKAENDPEANWPEPKEVRFTWRGKDAEGKPLVATIDKVWGERMDRVDVMHEVPKFVKQIVAGAAGTRPYIYQYYKPATLKVKIGEHETEEEGVIFSESTFIS